MTCTEGDHTENDHTEGEHTENDHHQDRQAPAPSAARGIALGSCTQVAAAIRLIHTYLPGKDEAISAAVLLLAEMLSLERHGQTLFGTSSLVGAAGEVLGEDTAHFGLSSEGQVSSVHLQLLGMAAASGPPDMGALGLPAAEVIIEALRTPGASSPWLIVPQAWARARSVGDQTLGPRELAAEANRWGAGR